MDLAPVGRRRPSAGLTDADLPTFPATLWGLFEQRVAVTPDKVLIEDDTDRTLTARQWRDASLEVAAALYAQGISAGTTVSWQLPTLAESAILMLALARLGAVQNPIIHILREREVSFIVGQLESALLITPSVWRGVDYGELAAAVAAERGCASMIIERGKLPSGDPASLPPPPTGEGDPVRHVYYSSGTTAEPKGARHTDRSVMAAATATVLMSDGDDVSPVAFPFTHIGGIAQTVTSLYTGAPMVLFEAFDKVASPIVMAAHGATKLGSSLPFFLAFAAAQREHGSAPLFPRLRSLASGGAPKPPGLFFQMREVLGVPILSNWGLTEFPIATASFDDDLDVDLATTEGRPLPNVSVKVVGADGVEVGPGQEGELMVKGPQALKGYVDASLDAAAFDAEGYFHTGDIGFVGPRGHVTITGRTKDIIIRNAENLSALEIEGVVYSHPKVADVAVIGVPDPRTGERALAVIVLAPGVESLTLAELAEHSRAQQLAIQKVPERLEFVAALPRNSMGKVLKQELRKRYTT